MKDIFYIYLVYNKCSTWLACCSIQRLTRFCKFEMTTSKSSRSVEQIIFRITSLRADPLLDIYPEKIFQGRKVQGPSWLREVRSVWNDVVSEVAFQPIPCVQRCVRNCTVLLEPNSRQLLYYLAFQCMLR